jgi:hypothetical protein
LLGEMVGHRYDIVGGLGADLMLRKRLVIRQDCLLRDLAQQVVHGQMEGRDFAHER